MREDRIFIENILTVAVKKIPKKKNPDPFAREIRLYTLQHKLSITDACRAQQSMSMSTAGARKKHLRIRVKHPPTFSYQPMKEKKSHHIHEPFHRWLFALGCGAPWNDSHWQIIRRSS